MNENNVIPFEEVALDYFAWKLIQENSKEMKIGFIGSNEKEFELSIKCIKKAP